MGTVETTWESPDLSHFLSQCPGELKTAIRNHLLFKELRIADLKEMPKEGLEPSRYCYHWILSPARLPVPPLRPVPLDFNTTIIGRHSRGVKSTGYSHQEFQTADRSEG